MARNDRFRGRYIHPEDFRDLRRSADLTRKQAADLLDVLFVPCRTGKPGVPAFRGWRTGCCASSLVTLYPARLGKTGSFVVIV